MLAINTMMVTMGGFGGDFTIHLHLFIYNWQLSGHPTCLPICGMKSKGIIRAETKATETRLKIKRACLILPAHCFVCIIETTMCGC